MLRYHPALPPCGRPSQSSPASRSSSPPGVAAYWFTAPSTSFDDLEVFRREAGPDASVRTAPSGLGRPLRAPASLPVGGRSPRHPLLGFGAPSATWATGSASPGLASPGTFRPRGFPPPRRVAPLPLRDHGGRCHSWGFRSRCGFRSARLPRVAAQRVRRPRCDQASYSEEHEVERIARSGPITESSVGQRVRRRSAPTASGGPLRSSSPPDRRVDRSLRHSPRALSSWLGGEPPR